MRNIKKQYLELLLSGLFVIAAATANYLLMGPAIIFLNAGLVIAHIVWVTRDFDTNPPGQKVVSLYLVAIAVQCLHFGEEYLTGFYEKMPALFGYEGWPEELFVGFNLAWLCLFVIAALGAVYKIHLAYLIVWFFAIAGGIGNGIGHSLISLYQGGYFPGLYTSFAALALGILLIRELVSAESFSKYSEGS